MIAFDPELIGDCQRSRFDRDQLRSTRQPRLLGCLRIELNALQAKMGRRRGKRVRFTSCEGGDGDPIGKTEIAFILGQRLAAEVDPR